MQVDLNDVIQAALDNIVSKIHTSIPCVVKRYDAQKRMGDIQPLIKTVLKSGKVLSQPLIQNVPFLILSGGGAVISFPIKPGDTVIALFSERSIDEWVNSSGDEIDPLDIRKHNLSDAIAICGIYPYSKQLNTSSDDLVISYMNTNVTIKNDGSIEINSSSDANITVNGNANIKANNIVLEAQDVSLKSGKVELGSGASMGITLAEKIADLFNAHTHTCTAPGSPSSPPIISMIAKTISSQSVVVKA
jgi:hypothetical protein